MNKIIRTFLALFCLILWIWALSTQWKSGDKSLPPIGAFMNPFSGFWKNAEPTLDGPQSAEEHAFGALRGKVDVRYDDHRIPHIFAENTTDLAFVQGFVTARDRLWQMDITTRKASGRLSEVLGERTLNIDRITRRRGMVYAAENTVLGWKKNPEALAIIEAYSAGVNAWIEQLKPAQYPIEFKLLNYQPEPWSILKTALVIESMADNLASRETDLSASQALAAFGRAAFDSIYPAWNPQQRPIVPDTGQWKDIKPFIPPVAPVNADLSGVFNPDIDPFWGNPAPNEPNPYLVGSNNWAVAGSRTASGQPLLANDPHLNLTLPSIWYQVQLHAPGLNCAGVSLPGIPAVVIGFNDFYAWGVTNVSHDVADWYRIHWTDASRTAYQLDGETREVKKVVETIHIKGMPTLYDTVRYTTFGPVTYDHEPKNPLRDCALRWLSHETPPEDVVTGFLLLNGGKTYADYRKGIAPFDCPAQNFVFASRSGDIGITVQGRYPLRAPEQGRFVEEGDRWQNTWQDYIPQENIPALRNPSWGYTFSANQHSTPPSYPYYYLGDLDDFRGRRIFNRLEALHQATIDSMKNMQLDNFSMRAYDALNALLPYLDPRSLSAEEQDYYATLANWNASYEKDQLAPTLFETWWDSCYARIWDEIRIPNEQGKNLLYPDAWRTIDMIKNDSVNRFFDVIGTPKREIAADIVLSTFRTMVQYYTTHPEKKQTWGAAKGFVLKHLGQIDAFGRKDIVVGGSGNSPNAITKTHGPSWRMIVDLNKQVKGLGVYPGGQSGNPGSKFYDDMVNAWANGEYYEVLLLKNPDDMANKMIKKETFVPAK
jgi:penicillin G amidase